MKPNIITFALLLLSCSCNGFLEESSQDEIKPSTIDDMVELLNGEALPKAYDGWVEITGIFTDDVQCHGQGQYGSYKINVEEGRLRYGWLREMFDASAGQNLTTFWEYPYKKIMGCNIILDYADRVSGEQLQKDNLKGEAYTLRGYYYLMLVNFFGQPYNVGDPAKNLGVPLKLTMEVTPEYFPRKTVTEVYQQIEKDLLEGNRLLEQNPLERGLYHMNDLAAKTLLSRMYLYMEKWDKSIEYGEKVLAVKPELVNFSRLEDPDAYYAGEGGYNEKTPEEIIWKFATSENGPQGSEYGDPKTYGASENLVSCYEYNEADNVIDLRGNIYFSYVWDQTDWVPIFDRIRKDAGVSVCNGIRNVELYLNLAEAYTHKYMESGNDEFRKKALENLNYLREHRYDTRNKAYQPLTIQNANDLFEMCNLERRRELCGEGNHRWFDLRRHGMPAIEHIYFLVKGEEQKYSIEKNSPRYVLPIPSQVLDYNKELVQNP